MFLFTVSVFKLRRYEQLSNQDMREESMLKIEDYSVYIDHIPIEPSKYNNDPHILAAMLVPYIEEEVRRELEL